MIGHSEQNRLRRAARLACSPALVAVAFCLVAGVLGRPGMAEGQASELTPLGSLQGSVSGCDDCSSAVSLTSVFPSGIDLGGENYTQLHIGSNGYITFGHGNSGYSPQGITAYTLGPIVAPQYDDLDPSKGGDVYYDQNAGAGHLVVTWKNVRPYSSPVDGSGTNSFQVVLRTAPDRAPTDFDIEIRYVDLQWARSGNNSAWPTAGWSAGDQATYAVLPGSGQSNFRDVQTGSNVGSAGVYQWEVTGGVVQSTPTVNGTDPASGITGTTAESGGAVSSDGGLPVTTRGVAYHTQSNPDIGNATASSGSGTGAFTATLTGLQPATTYYVRAFATNALGTAYGPQRSFTTLSTTPPTVATSAMSSVEPEGALAGGDVTSDGGAAVTLRGVAYGTDANPTTAANTATAGSGTGVFGVELEGLAPNTTYHVRAFATNSVGTAYGNDVSFTTPKLPQTILFAGPAEHVYGEPAFGLEATASSSLPVDYASSDPDVAAIADGTVTIVGAGAAVITASQAGDDTYLAADPVERILVVRPKPIQGTFTVPSEKVFDAYVDVTVTGRDLDGVEPADEGEVALSGGSAHFRSAAVGEDKIVTLSGAQLIGSRAAHYELAEIRTTLASVVPGPAHHFTLDGPGSVQAGVESAPFTVTVRDQYGNPTRLDTEATLQLSTDRERPTATFTPSDALTMLAGTGEASFNYANERVGSGAHQISVWHLSGSGLPGELHAERFIVVGGATVNRFRLEVVGTGPSGEPVVGEPFHIRITAIDVHGNVAEGFDGSVVLSSDGALDSGGGETPAFENGVLARHALRFTHPGSFTVRVSGAGGASGRSAPLEILELAPLVSVDLEVGDWTPALGDVVDLVVTATNRGPRTAYDVRIDNPLGGQHRLVAREVAPGQGSVEGDVGVWEVGTLEPGGSATLRILAEVVIP